MATIGDLHRRGAALLADSETPLLDAKVLLIRAAGLTEEIFHTRPEAVIPERAAGRFLGLVRRRRRGVPLSYLTGIREFWSLPLEVRPGVLIPRPETEILVEAVLGLPARPDQVIADIGTGCGAIALALASDRSQARIIATDISRRALRTACRNAGRLGFANITFLRGDLFAPLAKHGLRECCDVVVSNPPYLSRADWEGLAPGVRDHEPARALLAGPSGLEVIERIVAEAPAFLRPGGRLVLEIGAGQSAPVLRLFGPDWAGVACRPDLAGILRVITARKN